MPERRSAAAMNALSRLVSRSLSRLHPGSRTILASGMRVTVLAVAAKLFTVLREVMLAYRFGTSATVDGFNIAFTVTTWLPILLVSTAATGIVPLLVASVRDRRTHSVVLSELNAMIIVLAVLLSGIAAVSAPWASAAMTGAVVPKMLALTQLMIVQLAPVAGLSLIAGYLATRLQAQQRYLYTLGEALPPLGVALAAMLPTARPDGLALTTGLLVGTIAQILFLATLLARSGEGLGGFSLRFTSPYWPQIRGAVGTLALGAGILWVTVPVEQAYAARLGAGAVASLNYAARLIGLGTTIAIVIIARALLPSFSRAVADGEIELGRRQAWQWTGICGALGVICVVVAWPLIPFAVRLLLQRGAFGEHDVAIVTQLVQIGLLQLPFFFAGTAAVQWCASNGQFRVISVIATLTVAIKIVLLQLLVSRYGINALMISTVGMYAGALISHVFWLWKGKRPFYILSSTAP